MKIKIIDLLNKIANDEEVPKEIIYNDKTYNYVEGRKDNWKYQRIENSKSVGLLEDNIYFCLNDEVEIIEEPKKIEKISWGEKESLVMYFTSSEETLARRTEKLKSSLNELIDEINNLKEE